MLDLVFQRRGFLRSSLTSFGWTSFRGYFINGCVLCRVELMRSLYQEDIQKKVLVCIVLPWAIAEEVLEYIYL